MKIEKKTDQKNSCENAGDVVLISFFFSFSRCFASPDFCQMAFEFDDQRANAKPNRPKQSCSGCAKSY